MVGLNGVDWTDWLQTLTAIAAFLFAPAGMQVLWNRLRHRFDARCIPHRLVKTGGSLRWTIEITNASNTMRGLQCRIYPKTEGNIITHSSIMTDVDGGFSVSSLDYSSGSSSVMLDYISPGRTITFQLSFQSPDVPGIHGITNAISSEIVLYDVERRIVDNGSLQIAYVRLMTLLLSFVGATIALIVRLTLSGVVS